MKVVRKTLKITYLNTSKSLKIPLIATQEVFYLRKKCTKLMMRLTCIGDKKLIEDKNRFKLSDQHYFKKHEEL